MYRSPPFGTDGSIKELETLLDIKRKDREDSWLTKLWCQFSHRIPAPCDYSPWLRTARLWRTERSIPR
jgi:hypothetical protein